MQLRLRPVGAGAAIVAIALGAGWLLSMATTRVVNWYVMSDELYYERLAISVAHTGSLLPRIQGELVSNVNQVYPVLLSLVYGDGNVPASLVAAHRLNAFVMASAAVPVYLLARRVGVGRLVSGWVGALAVAVPWMLLSSFLLTEVVAYPVFCWALLALTAAIAAPSTKADAVALAAIALAVLARTQFLVLALVLAAAVLADAAILRLPLRRLIRERTLLVGAYLTALAIVLALAVQGSAARVLGAYSITARGLRFDFDLLQLTASHLAVLALATGILPFVYGAGWLVDRLRSSVAAPERALAIVGCATLVLLALQVASFNQRFGLGLVKERYFFYVLPVILVAVAAAIGPGRQPRWWTFIVPAAVCSAGFAWLPLPLYERLHVDSPMAILNNELVRVATSLSWARVLLVLATLVVLGFLLEARFLLSGRAVAIVVAVLATVVLPAETVYAFQRLFAVNGTNGLPVTLDQGGVFNWIDRAVGKDGRVTMVRYPVNPPDFWAGTAYWWDVEFWNESVVDEVKLHAGPGAEPWTRAFNPRTGEMLRPPSTRYVLVHGSEIRFRPAGSYVTFDRGAYLMEPERPWRAAWITTDIYGDGWTRPHVPAAIRVFAEPGQRTPLKRYVTIAVASPDPVRERPVVLSSNLDRWSGSLRPDVTVERLLTVCVPPAGHGTVSVSTAFVSDVYRDPTNEILTGETDRPAGVLLRSVALADEREPMDECPGG